METPDIEQYELGETSELITLETREENTRIALAMAQQSRSSLHIVSRKFDPDIFDTVDFIDAVKALALSSQHTQIKIIVFDINTIIKRRHRLLDLAEKLTSSIELRCAHTSFSRYNEHLMIADVTGYIHRQNGTRYEGSATFKDRNHCKMLLDQFNIMWELSIADVNLRKMRL